MPPKDIILVRHLLRSYEFVFAEMEKISAEMREVIHPLREMILSSSQK